MKTIYLIIEDLWKHLGSYDRQIALEMHDVMDVQEVLKVTDEIWSGLSFKVKREIYETLRRIKNLK